MHPIPEILEELRAGRMVVLVDDEHRENEGDLVLPAQFARGAVIGGQADSKVGSYLHFTGKVGVLIELAGEGEVSD